MLKQAWLIVANAAPVLTKSGMQYAQTHRVLVCDGAYQAVAQSGIHIDVLLGDFDSINPDSLAQARGNENVLVIAAPDQNKTDLEKAIEYIDTLEPKSIVVLHALGERMDHSLYNFSLLSRYYCRDRELYYVNRQEKIYFFQNQRIELQGPVGACISIFGFIKAKVTSAGLKYDMHDYVLRLDSISSVSNELQQTAAWVDVIGEIILVCDSECTLEYSTL